VKVGIIVFENVEVLDFAGPFEVFSAAARQPELGLTLETVGLAPEVICRGGLVVKPSRLLSEEPTYDLLIVPGGPGARAMVAAARAAASATRPGDSATGLGPRRSERPATGPDPRTATFGRDPAAEARSIIQYVTAHADRKAVVASVCTGAYFLAEAGLLDGRRATIHHGALEHFRETYPEVQVAAERYVDLGRVLTSGGVSAGIDMALHLVDRLLGPQVSQTVADILEWGQMSWQARHIK